MKSRDIVRVKMTDTVGQKVLKWFEHAEAMHGERLTIREHESKVEGRSDVYMYTWRTVDYKRTRV